MANFQFLPAEKKFYDWFEKGTANLLDAAQQLADLFEKYDDVENRVARLTELEHQGDFIVHEVRDLLVKTLIIPLDSEDIEHLISSLDDTLDGVEAIGMRMLIYRIEKPTERATQLALLIREGAKELQAAMPSLRDKRQFPRMRERIVEINTIENNGDRLLREGLGELVAQRGDWFEFMRWKEVYELLEQTTDRLEDVGDVLLKVIIKNG